MVGCLISFPGCTLSSYPETATDLINAGETCKYLVYKTIFDNASIK